MRLSAPKRSTFSLALLLALAGVASARVAFPILSDYSFWMVVAAYLVLAVGCLFEGI